MGKKILVLSDSLALPRNNPEVCDYVDTWPAMLKNDDYEVHQVSIGGATSYDLLRQCGYHLSFSPDFVIVQAGIVDCAPRALGRIESDVLNHFLLTRKILGRVLPKCNSFLRKHRAIKYTKLNAFKKNIIDLKTKFVDKDFFWIGIVPPNLNYEVKLPGITGSVKQYNDLLASQLLDYYISLSDIPESGVMSDHIHLTKFGHEYVCNLIKTKLKVQGCD